MTQIVDMCCRSKILTIPFELNIDKWETISDEVREAISAEWQHIKFMNPDGTDINDDISKVPNDRGGVYLFLLKPDIIKGLHRYIMYIGRAKRKKAFSLRKRCVSYIKDTRPSIAMMRELWGEYLYFFYLPLDDDELISKIEEELLRVIIPPCNTQIPYHYSDAKRSLF